jgi:transcriptional regulator with XRE-family HTH domain
MDIELPDEKQLKARIAANLAHYRKLAGFTQSELAERINYSDKSVSKWERGGGAPDIYVLVMLAELYGVTVNDLLSEDIAIPQAAPGSTDKRRIIICMQIVVAVWLIATVCFAGLYIVIPSFRYSWHVFLLAIPLSAVVTIVCSALWWNHYAQFLSVTALIWSVGVCVDVMIPLKHMYMIFIVCGVAQIIVLLWLVMMLVTDKKRTIRG